MFAQPGAPVAVPVAAEAPQKVLGQLQSEIQSRRLRVKELFEGFDPLNSGRCTSSQFQRGVNRLYPNVSPVEGKTLADYFTEQDRPGPQVVNYRKFSRTVDQGFSTPTFSLPRPRTTDHASPQTARGPDGGSARADARPATQGMPASARGERDFHRKGDLLPSARSALASTDVDDAGESGRQVVQKIRSIVKRRALRVHGAFHDFDPLRRGVCSPTHMRTALTVLNITLGSAEQDALLRLYGVHGWDRSDFDYRRFCNDVNGLSIYSSAETPDECPLDTPRGTPVHPMRPPSSGLATQGITEILAKLCRQFRDWRCDIKDAFLDAFRQFDPHHRGVITSQQFGRIISMQGFSFAEAELKSLCLAFTDHSEGGSVFRCQDFLDALSTYMAIHVNGDDRPCRTHPQLTGATRSPASKDSVSVSKGAANVGQRGAACVSAEAAAAPHAASSIPIAYPPTRCKSTAAYQAARRRLQAPK